MHQGRIVRVGIVGASGYTGMLVARIVAAHPHCELVFCTSDKWAGQSVRDRCGARVDAEMLFVDNARALDHTDVEAVFLATSAEVSMSLVPPLRAAGILVVDLSGGFRLPDPSEFERWYRTAHRAPALLPTAHYGLPELFGPPKHGVSTSGLIANPGCYPTAALLALGPLVRDGLIDPTGLIIDGKSGVTGAGRQASEVYSFGEVDGDFRAYKTLAHQHTPEMEFGFGRLSGGGRSAKLTFTPHLLPVRRGLIATCYARPAKGARASDINDALRAAYAASRFVRVVAPEEATLSRVVGTNDAVVGATANDDVVVSVGAIDNLIKGAAGQAVQNFNLFYEFDEASGLDSLLRSAP